MEFGSFFVGLLSEFEITQAQFSRDTGIPKTTVSGWVNAGRLPDYNSLRLLCKYFQISGDEILGLNIVGNGAIGDEEVILLEKYKKSSKEVKEAVKRLLNL